MCESASWGRGARRFFTLRLPGLPRGVELAGLASRHPASSAALALAASLGSASMDCRNWPAGAMRWPSPSPQHSRPRSQLRWQHLRGFGLCWWITGRCDSRRIDGLEAALAGLHAMAAANLLHAPSIRRLLEVVAAMHPHHLELRASVPEPERRPESGGAFGGGVTIDPGAGFLPVLMSALGSAVESVSVPEMLLAGGWTTPLRQCCTVRRQECALLHALGSAGGRVLDRSCGRNSGVPRRSMAHAVAGDRRRASGTAAAL